MICQGYLDIRNQFIYPKETSDMFVLKFSMKPTKKTYKTDNNRPITLDHLPNILKFTSYIHFIKAPNKSN